MPQDAITLSKTAKELNDIIAGAKINRINQPTADEIVLSLYCKSGAYKLCVCANAISARVGFTTIEKKNPTTPTGFCMLLRKHLLNATVKTVVTVESERIVKITFDGKNEFLEPIEKQLYCEIMGKYSNVIFCENEIICGTLKTSLLEIGKERALLTGVRYALPKSQGKCSIFDKEKSIEILNAFSSGDLSDYLFNNFQGFSLITAQEITFREFGKTVFEKNITLSADFYNKICDFANAGVSQPNVVSSLDKLTDFYFCDYKSVKGNKFYFDSLLQAETYFFDTKQLVREFNELKNKLTSTVKSKLKKEEKKLQIIREKELACSDAETLRQLGELIISNIYKIKRGDKTVTVENYYDDNNQLEIKLDEQLSPNANAQKYFKRYNKLKNTLKAIGPQKEQAEYECEYLQSVLAELQIAQNVADLTAIEDELKESGIIKVDVKVKTSKKQEKIEYRIFEYNGYTIYAGKNNVQNDKLTFSARPSDLWLHTKDYHSAHVVIPCGSSHIPDEILQLAAEICAYYSEAKNGDKVPVDYTQRKYVKKPPKSKYGAVLYTDFKTVYVTPNAHKNLEK